MSFKDVIKKGILESFANTEITFNHVMLVMIICLIISCFIYGIYYYKARKYFFSKEFAISLIALSTITAAVILAVQSSIVVSLGMVGALSIVRFRTAIKNPLDLVFLFWSISVGIICGAGLFYIAVLLSLITGVVILLFDEVPGITKNKLLVLNGTYPYNSENLNEIIQKYVKWSFIKCESISMENVNLIIEVRGIKDCEGLLNNIKALEEFDEVSLINQEGTID